MAISAWRDRTLAFLDKREEFLSGQAAREKTLANRMRREVEWLRRGPAARTGKSAARIKEAGRLSDELAELKYRNNQNRNSADRFQLHRGGASRRSCSWRKA